jgi:hypothetical protein
MIRPGIAGVLALLVVHGAALSAQLARPPLSPAAAQQDFDVLRRAMEEAHGGFYRFVDKAELDRRLHEHRARLVEPISQLRFASVISKAVAEINDGHARVELDSSTAKDLADARVLPLRVALEDSRLIVRFNDSPTDTVLRPGTEVVSINGRPVESIIRELSSRVSRDGFIETGRRHRIAAGFPQLYWLFIEQTDKYTILARDTAGNRTEIALAGILERDRRSITNPVNTRLVSNLSQLDAPPGTVALDFPEKSQVARLRVRAFGGEGFPATLDSAFRVMRERRTSQLILDLRGNGGGVDEYGALLLSYLVDRPFRYFDYIKVTTIAPSFATWLPSTFESLRKGTQADRKGGFRVTPALHPGVGEQQPRSEPFLGKLIVLIDGGSFSTTADVAAHLRSWRRGVFVGEETAGTYEGNTSGLNALIVLPNSRLRFKVMMYGYWNAVEPQPGGRGVIPEHIVPVRVIDLLHGNDVPLGAALALLNSDPPS